MKTLFLLAVVLAAGAQAREPENLAAMVDEMAVLERVLGAALGSEVPKWAASRYDFEALHRQTGVHLERWLQESVRTIKVEYLARQGFLVSLEFSHRPSARDLPGFVFETMARTGEIRLPGLVTSLEPDHFAELKRLVDERDEARMKRSELEPVWQVELRNAAFTRVPRRPEVSGPIGREVSALAGRQNELHTATIKEIQRLRGLLEEPAEGSSTDNIHGVLMRAVCNYATLKSLPDDEHLTLKVRRSKGPREGGLMGVLWTYHVLAKQDVVECRKGTIDAAELRHRAYVY
ncbi:MAG: hypothetical protein OXQ90_12670 [Gammaproteobacteria bacterium]|nr:hypothetical protein [Gammaproteobacteria bacterium]